MQKNEVISLPFAGLVNRVFAVRDFHFPVRVFQDSVIKTQSRYLHQSQLVLLRHVTFTRVKIKKFINHNNETLPESSINKPWDSIRKLGLSVYFVSDFKPRVFIRKKQKPVGLASHLQKGTYEYLQNQKYNTTLPIPVRRRRVLHP